MPSAIPAKLTKQPSTTTSTGETGVIPPSTDAATLIAQSIENKIRNLEKRKTKLDSYGEDLKKGKTLTKEQKEAAEHIGEVEQQLESMKDLLKMINDIIKQQHKQRKAEKKAEQKEQKQLEITRIRDLLRIQDILSSLGNDNTRDDFIKGTNGAIKLNEADYQLLDKVYQKLCPCHEDLTEDQNWPTYLNDTSLITWSLLTNSVNAVPFCEGKTYRDVRALVEQVASCGYFDNKCGRAQSPEQAKSEAASTISNPEDSARTEKADVAGQQISQSANVSSFNGGNGTAAASGGAPLSSSVSPPRQTSPSDIIVQSGQPNTINFLQDDQSSGAYASNFEAASMPYTETFASSGYNQTAAPTSGLMYNPQQPQNISSTHMPGYPVPFDSNISNQMHMVSGGGGTEQMMPNKQLDPNAMPFVSHGESMNSNTMVSAMSQMHQEPIPAQFYTSSAVEEQRMSQDHVLTDEHIPADGTNDGSQQFNQSQHYGGYGGRGGRGGGGYRGSERGGYNTGRGRGGGGGYRGGQGGNWSGYDGSGGYRGRGGGHRGGGYRNNDESGGQGRGGYNNRRGGTGGYEQRGGGRGGGATSTGYQRGGNAGGRGGSVEA